MVEREHGAGRQGDAERDAAGTSDASGRIRDQLQEASSGSRRQDLDDDARYRRQMVLGLGVQSDFDEVLAEAAK